MFRGEILTNIEVAEDTLSQSNFDCMKIAVDFSRRFNKNLQVDNRADFDIYIDQGQFGFDIHFIGMALHFHTREDSVLVELVYYTDDVNLFTEAFNKLTDVVNLIG